MKNNLTETNPKAAFSLAHHFIGRVVCLGAVILICTSASARNLFMSDGYSGIAHNLATSINSLPAEREPPLPLG